MSLSPEVKAAIEKIRQDNDLIASMREANKIRDKQLADLQAQVDAFKAQSHISDDDRQALADALADVRDTHDELTVAVPANTENKGDVGNSGRSTPADGGQIDGPSASDGGAPVPLMPNSSFDPAGGVAPPPAAAGQPNQPRAIETAGGFVIAGGGSTSRAPGSFPDSPSSSVVIPDDPDAKGPASNADLVKSGLGDSSQNALLGNDGQPAADGPGIPKEPSEQDAKAEQDRQDVLAVEVEVCCDNLFNLALAGMSQVGSSEADKAAQQQRLDEQEAAKAKEQAQNDAEQGKPAPGSPGPDPVSAPVDDPNAPAP